MTCLSIGKNSCIVAPEKPIHEGRNTLGVEQVWTGATFATKDVIIREFVMPRKDLNQSVA